MKHNERTETNVSASKENKQELELERKRQREEEAKSERKSMRLYGIVAAVVAVIAVAVLVVNTGVLQRNVAAVTVNGTKFTAADMQYYYNMEYQNAYQTSMTYAMYGMPYEFDYTKPAKDQVYDEATGQSWEDYFVDSAKKSVTYLTALCDSAKANGYTLSENGQNAIDGILANINTAWIGSYNSRDAFLRSTYGSYMTYDRFVELLNMEALASDYVNSTAMALEYTDEDYQAYYQENADVLDTFTFSQFVLQARVPAVEEGQPERTAEEEKAMLEQLKAEKKAVAEKILAKLTAGEDPDALAEEFADDLFSTSIHTDRTGASTAATEYAEWAVDTARKTGDTTMAEYDGGSVFNYYVVRYEGRYLDTSKTADVRHALIAATASGVEPSQAEYDAAKAKAEELLAGWDGTEEGFATLAMQNSADSGSAAEGGLMTAVSKSSGFIAEFTDWALDPARKAGDTGIVQNTGSTTKGWHIMYYVADNAPIWERTADDALRNADYTAWEAEQVKGYEAVEGFGLKLV